MGTSEIMGKSMARRSKPPRPSSPKYPKDPDQPIEVIQGRAVPAAPGEHPTTVSIRMDVDLKTRLEAAAGEADRTLSQESMRRLRRSFNPNDMLADALDLLRQTGKLNPAGGHPYGSILALDACKAVFGEEPGALGAWFMQLYMYHRMANDRPGTDIRIKVKKLEIEIFERSWRELKQQLVPSDDKDLKQYLNMTRKGV
jgi:hypothetical protein